MLMWHFVLFFNRIISLNFMIFFLAERNWHLGVLGIMKLVYDGSSPFKYGIFRFVDRITKQNQTNVDW